MLDVTRCPVRTRPICRAFPRTAQLRPRQADRVRARGMALVVVLVVITMLSLGAFTLAELMLCEREAADLAVQQAQAQAAAHSGIAAVGWLLSQDEQVRTEWGGWYDNAQFFRGRLVGDQGVGNPRARFTVVARQFEENIGPTIRFGLEDESARLNLNVLVQLDGVVPGGARELLLGLPGMTQQIADAILDWMDADDEPREYGAEREYYTALNPPYEPANGPLRTIEELLLVRDVTPELLFGCDLNRNGLPDADEPPPDSLAQVDNADGSMTCGWAQYLTLYSLESNLRPDGRPKVYLNQDDMQQLYDELDAAVGSEWATFIVAYRQNGPYTGRDRPRRGAAGQLDLSKKGRAPLSSVLDLVDQRVRVQFEGQRESVVIESPFSSGPGAMSGWLPEVMDNLTVYPSAVIPGRININLAPRRILESIPGLRPEAVEAILGQRVEDPAEAPAEQRYETWILSQGIVSLEEMKTLMPLVTARGSVFRAQVIGYFEPDGPAARLEAIWDASQPTARLLRVRDLGHLGRGFALETLGIEVY